VLEAILQWLKHDFTDWDLLRLRSVCILSPTGRLLPTVARYAGFPSVGWLCATCAYIELPATFDEFLDRMPGRLRRKKHAQARRKLVREHGEPEVRLLEGEEVTAEVVDRFFALHGRAWASRGGSVMLRDRRVLAFHRDLVAAPAPVGVPTLLLMAVGGRDAAGYYGFRLGRTFFAYMSAYDPDLSVYSVGGQATLALVERGIELGWERIDLMKGAERYKLDYTHHCGQTVDHCVTRSRATMRLFCTAAALRGRLCP
jgi:CelD/BcsL family acetyltransferase involved in cellulose biosynthesis